MCLLMYQTNRSLECADLFLDVSVTHSSDLFVDYAILSQRAC